MMHNGKATFFCVRVPRLLSHIYDAQRTGKANSTKLPVLATLVLLIIIFTTTLVRFISFDGRQNNVSFSVAPFFFVATCKLARRKTAKAHDCMHAISPVSHVVTVGMHERPSLSSSTPLRDCDDPVRRSAAFAVTVHGIRQANASFAVAVVELASVPR